MSTRLRRAIRRSVAGVIDPSRCRCSSTLGSPVIKASRAGLIVRSLSTVGSLPLCYRHPPAARDKKGGNRRLATPYIAGCTTVVLLRYSAPKIEEERTKVQLSSILGATRSEVGPDGFEPLGIIEDCQRLDH